MPHFNRVILAGHLTRDPELTFTPSNTAICKFGLANNRKWKDAQGNQKEEVLFVDLTAFGKTAEVISQYFNKGKPILIEGRLHFDQWTGQDGQKRSKLSVVVESFQFLGGNNDVAPQQDQKKGWNKSNPRQETPAPHYPSPARGTQYPPTEHIPEGMSREHVPF